MFSTDIRWLQNLTDSSNLMKQRKSQGMIFVIAKLEQFTACATNYWIFVQCTNYGIFVQCTMIARIVIESFNNQSKLLNFPFKDCFVFSVISERNVISNLKWKFSNKLLIFIWPTILFCQNTWLSFSDS